VRDGDDGGGDVPRQTHERAHDEQQGHQEQVQMVARPFLAQQTQKVKGHMCVCSNTGEESLLNICGEKPCSVVFLGNISHQCEKNNNDMQRWCEGTWRLVQTAVHCGKFMRILTSHKSSQNQQKEEKTLSRPINFFISCRRTNSGL